MSRTRPLAAPIAGHVWATLYVHPTLGRVLCPLQALLRNRTLEQVLRDWR